MSAIVETRPYIRKTIISNSANFLVAVHAADSVERLFSLLLQIRKLEVQLMRQEGLMLHPAIWKILVRRFANWKPREIIDTLT